LGAGAAHELATPLSTIRTAAGELERRGVRGDARPPSTQSEFLTIIREEVDRCTRVLDQLSGRAAATSAAESRVLVGDLMDDLRYRLGESRAARLDVSLPPHVQSLDVPAEPLR